MKRYTCRESILKGYGPVEHETGEVVLFTDHQAELKALAAEVLPHVKRSNHASLPQMTADQSANFDALLAKLRAIAEAQP